jgi:hypothetical protein
MVSCELENENGWKIEDRRAAKRILRTDGIQQQADRRIGGDVWLVVTGYWLVVRGSWFVDGG